MRHGPARTWYSSGQLKSQYEYRDGNKNGPWMGWYENGKKWSEGTYRNGNKEGIETGWYDDGSKNRQMTFIAGVAEGPVTTWQNGKEFSGLTMKHGLLNGVEYKVGSRDGESYEHEYKDGKQIRVSIFDSKGVKKTDLYFEEWGLLSSDHSIGKVDWFANGQRESERSQERAPQSQDGRPSQEWMLRTRKWLANGTLESCSTDLFWGDHIYDGSAHSVIQVAPAKCVAWEIFGYRPHAAAEGPAQTEKPTAEQLPNGVPQSGNSNPCARVREFGAEGTEESGLLADATKLVSGAGGSKEKRTKALADAASLLEKAVQLAPGCAEAWSLLSYTRYRRSYGVCGTGDYSGAAEAGKKAVELSLDDPTKAAAIRNLGRIAAAQARWSEAQQHVASSLQLDPDNEDAKMWAGDLALREKIQPPVLSAVAKAMRGEPLDEGDLEGMTTSELRWVGNAPLARFGRILNRAPQDWFFFCEGSPLPVRGTPDASVSSHPVKTGSVDDGNVKLTKRLLARAAR